jgi:osmotically-inducible protein OsmY
MIMPITKDFGGRLVKSTDSAGMPGFGAETAIQRRYHRSPYLPLRKIDCFLDDGVLTLRGRVPTYYLKQLAQSIGVSTHGVHQVVNELRVDFPKWG